MPRFIIRHREEEQGGSSSATRLTFIHPDSRSLRVAAAIEEKRFGLAHGLIVRTLAVVILVKT